MSVALDHVTRTVSGVRYLRDISLNLERGTLNVLLGPTLSGKTSLMRLLAGLDRPDTGRVLVDGKDVTGFDVRKRSVAMVYQQFINYPSLTVFENIASPLRVSGQPKDSIGKRVQDVAKLLKLEPYLDRTPLQLSGGQQQRTAIARALVKGADLVLLDEPLANLDYKLREELRAELPRIFEASGAIFVYATTEPTEALLLGGRTICMWEGEILQAGDTPSVYRRPQSLRVAEVFSDPPLNKVGVEKKDGSIHYATGERAPANGLYRDLADGGYRVGFRAHQLAAATGKNERPLVRDHRAPDRDHRLGKLRAPEVRRRQLGGGDARRGRIRAGRPARCGNRSDESLHLRPRRAAGRSASDDVRDAMARIDLVDLAHSYQGPSADAASYALKPMSMTWRQGGAYALLGPSGCGKTTLLNIISGLVKPSRGQDPVRRQGRHAAVNAAAQHRAGVPVPGDLRHHDGGGEPRLPAEEPRHAARQDRRAGCGDRAAARPHAVSRPQGDAADGGRQAEDLARPRPRAARRGGDPVRRAADRDRSAPEVGAALEAEGAAPRARPDDDLRDPRPDRGADLRRHGGRHAGRPGRAERHAAGAVREARAYLRRLLHRLAGHEHPARRRAGPARAPVGPPDRAAAQLRQASAGREDRDRRAPGVRAGRGARGRRC